MEFTLKHRCNVISTAALLLIHVIWSKMSSLVTFFLSKKCSTDSYSLIYLAFCCTYFCKEFKYFDTFLQYFRGVNIGRFFFLIYPETFWWLASFWHHFNCPFRLPPYEKQRLERQFLPSLKQIYSSAVLWYFIFIFSILLKKAFPFSNSWHLQ